MMWNTIATFKENLSQIALDVQDAAEELETYGSISGDDVSSTDRRVSHRFAQSKSPQQPLTPNGIDSGFKAEMERYKSEIQRLQASEAEIKALSVNYAAILKEKEESLSRLNEENGSMRKMLEGMNAVGHASKNERLRMTNNSKTMKVTGDKFSSRLPKYTPEIRASPSQNLGRKDIFPSPEASSNGSVEVTWLDGNQRKAVLEPVNSLRDEKELADLFEENKKALAILHTNHESEMRQLRVELDKEHENLVNVTMLLQAQQKLNESSQKELCALKMDKDKISVEMKGLRKELDEKISEIKRLQSELTRIALEEEVDAPAENLRSVITALEKENTNLKREKGDLENALKLFEQRKPDEVYINDSDASHNPSNKSNEAYTSVNMPGKELPLSELKLDKALNDACRERDKALQELARLKQHLLDKELEESDKMDEDRKVIEELKATSEYQRVQILHLENALKQAMLSKEEAKKISHNELNESNEIINDLKNKLASCMSLVDSKNVELLNLQSALGQYYAESEAKERLGRDLAVAREECAKLFELLKDANQSLELSKRENEEMFVKFSQADRMLSESKQTAKKLEEDNLKLRRALEQSMTRLNRMSMDSDYFVDRRIVIKLLVTYFKRNHSKEVLDLMVRMLGFSEEDKQRIGFAQQVAGKGVVRGVLGLPGRLVGGILGGSSHEVQAHVPSENQSFSDLWVDFLLKESEERERRESAEAAETTRTSLQTRPSTTKVPPVVKQSNRN